MDAILLPLIVFGAVVMVGLAVVIALQPQESATSVRLHTIIGGEVAAAGGARSADSEGRKAKKKNPLAQRLALKLGNAVRSSVEGGGGDDETAQRLAMAGYGSPSHVTSFHGMRLMIGLGAGSLGAIVTLVSGATLMNMMLASVGGLIAGMILPSFVLGFMINKRKEKIGAALPNMVDLLVVCVEAGLGLDAAMSRVGQELIISAPELSRELLALGRELSAGQSHEHALSRLAWRIGIDDVENLVSMLIQAERFGTSIATSLRVFSDSYRTARRQRVEEAAAKTTIKLLFPLVFFIFPAIFVILLGPAVVGIVTGGALGN